MKLSKEFKVGLLALISGIVLYFGFNFLKGLDLFTVSNEYMIVYNDIKGLKPSNSVMLNGLAIGRVSSIELLPEQNNKMLVRVQINNDEIEIGDSSQFVLSTDPLAGASIILKLKKNTKVYTKKDTIRGILEQGLADLIKEKTFPIIANLDSTVMFMNDMMNEQFRKDFHDAMSNLNKASKTFATVLQQNSDTITDIMSNANTFMKNLQQMQKSMTVILDKANQFADTLNDLDLKQAVDKMNESMITLNAIMKKINEGDGTLGLLVNNKELYNTLLRDMQVLGNLLQEFQYNPKKYLKPLGSKPKRGTPQPQYIDVDSNKTNP